MDGLEGRPLICKENRGTRKVPQVIQTKHSLSFEKLATIVYIYNFLAAGDNRVST